MSNVVKFDNVMNKVVTLKNKQVIVDSDVAELYGVETKRVNEAVKNNPDKFPKGYVIELEISDLRSLRSKISTANYTISTQPALSDLAKLRTSPKAFTEKGLYMLATILKSECATQTTIAIVETFAKLRELTRTISQLTTDPSAANQVSLQRKTGGIIDDLLGDELKTTNEETSIELNLAVVKFKHTIKRKKD